jgi:hypothetical protein
MDSTAQKVPKDSEISNELLSRVTQGFDSPNSPEGLRNNQRAAVTGDDGFDSPNSPSDSKIINELLSQVTHGFDSPNSP